MSIPVQVKAALDSADCAGGVTEELIRSTEERYDLVFSTEYRFFLRRYGAALLPGFEVYGLIESRISDGPPVWTDLRNVLRNLADNKIPLELIPISDDGGDYKFYMKSNADAVVIYGPGLDGDQVARGFFEFLGHAMTKGIASLVRAVDKS